MKKIVIGIALILMVLMSGCISLTTHVKINDKGEIEEYIRSMNTSSQIYGMINQQSINEDGILLKERVTSQGGTYREIRDGDSVQIIITGLIGENATINFGDDNKTYIFRDIVVSDKEKEPEEDNPFFDEEEMSIKYHYYLEMPSNIIESNADTVSGNKAEWHMTNQ